MQRLHELKVKLTFQLLYVIVQKATFKLVCKEGKCENLHIPDAPVIFGPKELVNDDDAIHLYLVGDVGKVRSVKVNLIGRK